MPASYPNAVKTFASRSNGQTIDATHVGDLQDEVSAIEDGLLNGTAPLTSSNASVQGLNVAAPSTLHSTMTIGAVRYQWPSSAAASTGQVLTAVTISGSTHRVEWRTPSVTSTGDATFNILTLSSAAPATPAANRAYANTLIKAWASVSSTPALVGQVNFSAVSTAGEAKVALSFATALGDSNYACVASQRVDDLSGNMSGANIAQKTSTGFVVTSGAAGSTDLTPFSVMVIGAN